MAYSFDQVFAADPSNTSNVAANSSVLIFAPGDAAKTPLTLTTTNGQPLANPVVVNANGFGPAFMHATLDRVAWEGGGFTGFFSSYEGMKAEAVAARAAAESSAASSATSASLVNAPADTAVETLINGTGTATRAALNATFATGGEVRSKVKADGTDQTAVLQGELNALANGQGGTLLLPSGVIRVDGRLTIPYTLDGTGAPIQPAIRIRGNGKRAHGRGSGIDLTPTGGTVLDLRYSNADLKKARFQSTGFGYLEISEITFSDQGATASANPFFKHTNTTVNIHDIAGIGHSSQSGATCTQDLIIAGGHTMPASGDFSLDDDAPFQGYGSEYRNIWHNRIRRAMVLGAYANQVKIDGVYGWQNSGNSDGGSVEIDPGPTSTQGVNGVQVSNVLSESLYYKYGVYARKLSRSTISNIGSYDYAGNTTYISAIGLHSCDSLTIIAGYDDLDGLDPYVSAAAGSAFNNWRDMATLFHPSQSVNAPGTSISAKFTAWQGVTTREPGGGAGTSLVFARSADAATGPQAGFASFGTKWQYDGTGGPMSIDTGTGGSYFDLKAYGMRWYSHAGALLGVFGAGKEGFALGADGDVTIERHATGIVKSNGRMRGNGGLSTALTAEPAIGTIDNGECVFWLDGTAGATKLKIIAKDSAGTVRRGEIALA